MPLKNIRFKNDTGGTLLVALDYNTCGQLRLTTYDLGSSPPMNSVVLFPGATHIWELDDQMRSALSKNPRLVIRRNSVCRFKTVLSSDGFDHYGRWLKL